jgi:CTP:molybdopterin cytidylyltransferase MocA
MRIIENPAWHEGMGTSIRAGITAAVVAGNPDGILIALCDQPYFSAQSVRKLISMWNAANGAPNAIVAARYAGRSGVPAIFGKNYFAQLRALSGPEGARHILSASAQNLTPVDLPDLAADVDTPEDWARVIAQADKFGRGEK